MVDEASLKDTDLFIAVTGRDVVNLAACSIAKREGCATIARINNPDLTEMPENYSHQDLLELMHTSLQMSWLCIEFADFIQTCTNSIRSFFGW